VAKDGRSLPQQEWVIHSYLVAKARVEDAGYEWETKWQESRDLQLLSETEFLRETAWVILSSGMREKTIRNCFCRVSDAFFHWVSAKAIVGDIGKCMEKALRTFNHKGKIFAIASAADRVASRGFENIVQSIENNGIDYLRTFDYVGKVTAFHLAKNIGFDVVKPDRHLVRLANAAQFNSPMELCQAIAKETGERLSVIDVVLWRYATLFPKYIEEFTSKGSFYR